MTTFGIRIMRNYSEHLTEKAERQQNIRNTWLAKKSGKNDQSETRQPNSFHVRSSRKEED